MQSGLEQIAEASRRYGADPQYVFGGGGNTSWKSADTLYVKPSGVELRTIRPEEFVPMSRAKIQALFSAAIPADPTAREAKVKELMLAAVCPGGQGRPSVEAPMHELFPQTFVVHTHSILLNGLSCAQDGEAACRRLFPQAMWIPYVDPGFTLSKTIYDALAEYRRQHGRAPAVTVMQNHGLVVAADTIAEVDAIHEQVMGVLREQYGQAGIRFELAEGLVDLAEVRRTAPALRTLLGSAEARAVVHCGGHFPPPEGAFTPDHIVYCRTFWHVGVPTPVSLAAFKREKGYAPLVVSAPGQATYAAGPSLKMARLVLMAARNAGLVRQFTAAFGGPRYLNEREYRFIENWEVENYRKAVTLGAGGPPQRLAGKVALVTGAAQGFGYGIAAGLLGQGATVLVADINRDGAVKACETLAAQFGPHRAVPLAVNIADEESVATLAGTVARECGGLDLLIANAGVLRADSVKTFKKQDWDFVTSVNYTGYFLCVKHLAPVMAAQIVEGQGGWSDIIQINSKSGLEGSNRNAAYAGSKFGGIGLTQSFAMELVSDRIKVNAICPGNFFDGPLWSDPTNGLFVQYLRAKKVPGATTVAEVRKAYEAKVPMGRGCEPEDVLKAILYCVEQAYETGQAIPVTGGQIMLN